MRKKKYKDMTPEEQYWFRITDFGVTYFNGVRLEQDQHGNWLRMAFWWRWRTVCPLRTASRAHAVGIRER